jgi:serine/threonine-protein kinase
LRNEALALAQIQEKRGPHPNIAELYDIHQGVDYPCVVLELVDGVSMSETITCAMSGSASYGARFAARTAYGVGCAIQHMTAAGFVHRDLAPRNVLVSREGRAKLIDFGIAKESPYQGEKGKVAGVLAYTAPEELSNAVSMSASDVFRLGALTYELTRGESLFWRSNAFATRFAIVEGDIAFKEGTILKPEFLGRRRLRRLDAISRECLVRDPAGRKHIDDVVEALGRASRAIPL